MQLSEKIVFHLMKFRHSYAISHPDANIWHRMTWIRTVNVMCVCATYTQSGKLRGKWKPYKRNHNETDVAFYSLCTLGVNVLVTHCYCP